MKDKISVCEKLIKIYGIDDQGANELEYSEIHEIEENDFWTGRNWTFNEIHGLKDFKNKNEPISYVVSINLNAGNFSLQIINYDCLVDFFN
jgi:hypothetical protein